MRVAREALAKPCGCEEFAFEMGKRQGYAEAKEALAEPCECVVLSEDEADKLRLVVDGAAYCTIPGTEKPVEKAKEVQALLRERSAEPACPGCGMTSQVEPSRKEPGRYMCHGCARFFDRERSAE
jgi:hypothetical protein